MTSFFSIVLINFNKGEYISEAIESVLSQSYPHWELLVIDDNSSDNSLTEIEKFLKDERIIFLENKINVGKTKNLKKGIQEANGEIIVILDSDDALDLYALEKINNFYKKNPKCDYLYSQCYYCDKNLKPVHLGFSKKITEGKTNLHDNSVVALRSFKKSAYLKTSGYDAEIKYAEDIDLTLKMEEIGKLCFLDEPLYYYRVLPNSQSHGFKNTQINRSSTALAKLNAYKRRLGTNIPNLDRNEISEVLFFGIFTSILAMRLKLTIKFIKNIFIINPLFFISLGFYKNICKKIIKILKLKKEKPLLKL